MKSAFPIFASILLLLIGGQVYWIRRLAAWSRRLIPRQAVRTRLGAALLATLILLFASNFGWLGRRPSSTHMTLKDALVTAPFAWWAFSSMVAFAVIIIFWIVDRIVRAAGWTYRKLRARFSERDLSDSLPSPPRRRFLERTALAVSAVPFVASAYGLVHGGVDLHRGLYHAAFCRRGYSDSPQAAPADPGRRRRAQSDRSRLPDPAAVSHGSQG